MLRISCEGYSNLHTKFWPPFLLKNSKIQNLIQISLFHSSVFNSNKRLIEEPEISGKKFKRKRYSFDSNQSIARKISDCKDSNPRWQDQIELQDAIADHAYRRIQIFYYQSLVYFQSNCNVSISRTEIQHGKANHPWSNASHSSLLTNLRDNYFEVLQKELYQEKISERSAEILKALGVSEQKIHAYRDRILDLLDIQDLLDAVDIEKGLIHPTSTLYASMNATVELPEDVNIFDTVIENKMREVAIQILNRVSKEGLHPYQATQLLVSEMQAFFKKSIDETREKLEEIRAIKELEKQLWVIESNLTSKVVLKYLETIRILNSKYERLNSLREYSIQKKIGSNLGWRADLLQCKKINKKKLLKKVKVLSAVETHFSPEKRDQYVKKLEDSIDIIKIQWDNTRTPPFKSLSGRLIGNVVHPSTDVDLFKEQLQIIRRD